MISYILFGYILYQSMEQFKVKRLTPDAKLPLRSSPGAAGYDLFSNEKTELLAGDVTIIKTGIAVQIPEGYYGRIAPRSSLGVRGVDVFAGVIDADYRGEVGVILYNTNNVSTIDIDKYDRIAQLILTKITTPDIIEVDELDKTDRGKAGYGSTGK